MLGAQRLIYLLSFRFLIADVEAFFPRFVGSGFARTKGAPRRSSVPLFDSSRGGAETLRNNIPQPTPPPRRNEFSRTVQPERILKARRDYNLEVEASAAERGALATRFDLTDVHALQASLVLRPEGLRASGVEVEGTISASVTQTCVRTNERFQVNVEFPLECIVRPVRPLSHKNAADQQSTGMRESRSSQASTRNKKKKSSHRPQDRSIEAMDLLQLQQLLVDDEMTSNDAVLMEDEAIYSTEGLLDVGELVSQLFWLQLDPYPKKPGSKPIQTSITG